MKDVVRIMVLLYVILLLFLLTLKAEGEVHSDESQSMKSRSQNLPDTSRTQCNNAEGLPPVGDQVVAGSCYAWAAAYYYLTYLQWQEYGWDVTDPAHQCSPAFVYNLTNGGVDNGAWEGDNARHDAFKVFETLGCATMADMPYRYYEYLNFPSEAAFRNGLRLRTLSTHHIYTNNFEGIEELKNHLLEGNIAVLGILGYGNLNDISLYGNTYCVSQTYGGRMYWHDVTAIGFDDKRVTADGVGAFRLVNSWSTSWGDSGFFWMSYEAVMDPKTSYGYAMYATDRIGYEPSLTARIDVEHPDRYNLIYSAGIGEIESPDTTLNFFSFNPMSLQAGVPYPEGAIVLDLTDLTGFIDTGYSNQFFITITDNGFFNGLSGTIASFAIEDITQNLSSLSPDTPVPIPDTYDGAVATATFSNSFLPPEELTVDLDTATGHVQLTWEPPAGLGTFIDYRVYRDGKLVDSTASTTYADQLHRHGYHQYGVSAHYEGGESLQKITGLFWPFPFGIPFADGFEYGLGGWEQLGNSDFDAVLRNNPVFEGDFAIGLQTHLEDNTVIGRSFEPMEGVDVEVWFNMESYPVFEFGFGGCIGLGSQTGENLGVFVSHNGNPACIEVRSQQEYEVEVLDSLVVMELDIWYKHKVQCGNGKLHAMLLDDEWNVLVNDIVYVRDFRISQVVLIAWGLDQGWNYFDAFSIREWTGPNVEYFSPVRSTNKPYALIVTEVLLDDDSLSIGDEIAVFDDDLCVGAVMVDGEWPIELNVWEKAGSKPGFFPGNPMIFRIWHWETESEHETDVTLHVGDGSFGYGIFSRLSLVASPAVSVSETGPALPTLFHLSPAYPNPFNPVTNIEFSLPEAVKVKMEVYDVLGQVVHVLINSELEAGYHTVKWNASGVSSGMYFYRLTAGDFSACRKMLLLR